MSRRSGGSKVASQAVLPSKAEAVVPAVLYRQATIRPTAICVRFEDGGEWTYSDAATNMWRSAAALKTLGVENGDRVLICLDNGPDFLRAWWGVAAAGAVMVPLNTAYKGPFLTAICEDIGARFLITSDEYLQAFRAAGYTGKVIRPPELADQSLSERPVPESLPNPWDAFAINYTSGTTGPSKGAFVAHVQNYVVASTLDPYIVPGDVMLVDLPLFHQGGQTCTVMWRHGATIALRGRFTGTRYWDIVRETGATISTLISSMPSFLLAQPRRRSDRRHSLRVARIMPMVRDHVGFRQRFGVSTLLTAYGMTELSAPLFSDDPSEAPGSAGRLRAGFDAQLVNEYDIPVGDQEIGELIVRADMPWAISTGYVNRPVETAVAWRNGWFHTGDLFRTDRDGNYYFVTRRKDAIRRRGENISAIEVEREALAYPGVAEAACVGYPTEFGDEEVKLFVVPTLNSPLNPEQLVAFMAGRLPAFMVPKFTEVVTELPKTPTLRVKKYELRARGNTTATWARPLGNE